MNGKNSFIRIYSGNEVKVNLLKGRLEIAGIYSTIRNDSIDSYLGGVPVALDLYLNQSDYKKAKPIIREFVRDND